jgi:phage tail sheath protein FI
VVYRSELLDVLVDSEPYVEARTELPPHFDEAAQRALREALVRQCETRKDRVALIDLPNVGAGGDVLLAHRHETTSSYAAADYPWLLVPDPFGREGPLCAVPPSGHIAGVYARNDLTVGVHRPPANLPLMEVSGVAARMSDALHGELFHAHVNAIVEVHGRGPRVMGARTLSDHDGLRYLNVRRLLIMIASTLEAEGALLIFEPSRGVLRAAVDRVLRTLLERLWLEGALDGESEEEAYSVRMVDAGPPRELDDARVAFEVVLTPPFPSEQVVLRVAFTSLRLEVVEPIDEARVPARKPVIEAYEPWDVDCADARESRVDLRALAREPDDAVRVSACRQRDEARVSSHEPPDAGPRASRERR